MKAKDTMTGWGQDLVRKWNESESGLEEVANLLEDDKEGGGDGEEAGAGGQHGPAVFFRHFCGGLRSGCVVGSFLIISLKSLSFLHPVHVGSGIWVGSVWL